jgi:hypothetical protein
MSDNSPLCAHIQPLLQRFSDGELDAVERTTVEEHLQSCDDCRAQLAEIGRFHNRLRTAARQTEVPFALQTRIRARLEAERRPQSKLWLPLAVAACSMALFVFRAWQTDYLRLTPDTQTAYVDDISATLPKLMRVGFVDHLHCTIFGKNYAKHFDLPRILESLGTRNSQLYPIFRQHLPAGYTILSGHICEVRHRKYLHLVAKNGDSLVSLLFTRRGAGEAFENDMRAVSAETGFPLYSADAQRFHLAAIETPGFLVFLVSDLADGRNAAILSGMSPQIAHLAGTLEL